LTLWDGVPSLSLAKALVPACYLLLAVMLTWPMAETFTTRLGGDTGGGFPSLWNLWGFKEALARVPSAFHTEPLRAPFGASLWFNNFMVPDAILALPLWWVLPPLGVYNAVVLWSFVFTGLGMYALVADWTGSRRAGFFAGAVFMAIPFRMAHALGHL